MRFLTMLLFFKIGFAQTPRLSVVIDEIQIESHESGETKYEVLYHITNNTENEIKFFLNPDGFGQPLNSKKTFMLFENDQRFTGVAFLNQKTKAAQEKAKADFDKIMTGGDTIAIFKELGMDISELKKQSKEGTFEKHLMENATLKYQKDVMNLKPLETKKFQQSLFWQKNRYYTQDDYEFYLNEKSKFDIQFTLILLKNDLKNVITDQFYNEIMQDKNFVKGVFASNKMAIPFLD